MPRLGWAFLPNIYAVATNDQSVAPRSGPVADLGATFEQPRLGGHPSLKQQSSIDLSRTIQQTYDNLGGRLTAGVVWQPRARVSIFPSYHLEIDYLNGSPINSAATAPLTLGCQTTSGSCTVFLSYIEEVVTWDHRDKPLEPRNGFYTSLSLQEGGGPLQGDFGYVRVLPEVRAYASFLDDDALTFAARLQLGELWSITGESAVVIRFYGGGANSMRGFSERRLSPLLAGAGPRAPADREDDRHAEYETVPIGGNGMFMGSFEARYSVLDNVRVAAFVDVGQVTTGLFGWSDLPGVLWAVGVGLRYLTPIGPIRLDIARRLPFGTLPALYTTDDYGTIIPPTNTYAVDESCFGFFGSHPSTAGERRRVHPADLHRGGVLKALRIAGATILVVLAIALLAIGGLWTFAQTDRGGQIIRRIAVEKVNAQHRRAAGGRSAAVRRQSAHPGGRRAARSGGGRGGAGRQPRCDVLPRGRSCAGTSTCGGWRSAVPSCGSSSTRPSDDPTRRIWRGRSRRRNRRRRNGRRPRRAAAGGPNVVVDLRALAVSGGAFTVRSSAPPIHVGAIALEGSAHYDGRAQSLQTDLQLATEAGRVDAQGAIDLGQAAGGAFGARRPGARARSRQADARHAGHRHRPRRQHAR